MTRCDGLPLQKSGRLRNRCRLSRLSRFVLVTRSMCRRPRRVCDCIGGPLGSGVDRLIRFPSRHYLLEDDQY